jgi:hypothetical protein
MLPQVQTGKPGYISGQEQVPRLRVWRAFIQEALTMTKEREVEEKKKRDVGQE